MEVTEIGKQLLVAERYTDLFRLARFMTGISVPCIENDVYDILVDYCNQYNVMQDYTNRVFEDDPIPMDLIEEFGLQRYVQELLDDQAQIEKEPYKKELAEEESLSIRPVFSYEEAYEWFQLYRSQKLVLSLKIDGVFFKSFYDGGRLQAGISRGRHGRTCFDYTYALHKSMPNQIGNLEKIKFQGEAYVEEAGLPALREKYPEKRFVGPRFAGGALSRAKYDAEDYEHYRTIIHGVDGLSFSLSEQYRIAEDLGFMVVPHQILEPNEAPLGFADFVLWLRDKLDFFWENYKHIPSDGLVVSVDDHNYDTHINGIYANKNLALKLEYWNDKEIVGVVKRIIIQQRRVYASCRVEIEPLTLGDGSQARVINVFNPSMLIEYGLREGARVYFKRTSNAINILSRTGFKNIEEAGE